MSSNDVVDLTADELVEPVHIKPWPNPDDAANFLEPPLKKRVSAKREQIEREFHSYLATLADADRISVRKSFSKVRREKEDILRLRQRYQVKRQSEDEEKVRRLIVGALDSVLLSLDEAVVNIRAGNVSVARSMELAEQATRRTRGVRGRIEGINRHEALHRLQTSSHERDETSMLNDRSYVDSRASSLVTPQATTTRALYRPEVNPPTMNQDVLLRAINNRHNPGLLPDGSVIDFEDRRAYLRSLREGSVRLPTPQSSMIRPPPLEGSDEEYEEDGSHSFGYQNITNYEELVDLALNEAEPLDMPPQMDCFPLEHQRQGLGWLVRAERGRNRGGVLADDMGLGKTVQTIALIYANPSPPPSPTSETPNEHRLVLIVCPVALIATWADELKGRVQRDHRYRVYIHHKGMNNVGFLKDSESIENSTDIVICTYNGIVNEFKSMTKYEEAVRRQMAYGNSAASTRYGPFPLFKIKWHRVVLDEAHLIKNRMSQMSQAVARLSSRYRLALTGTPMQNKLEELFPIIRFLKIRPYCDYSEFKKLMPPEKSSTTHDFETQKSLATFLGAVMLRRRKDTVINGKKIIDNLPAKHIRDMAIAMAGEEKSSYTALEKHIRDEVNRVPTSEDITFTNMLVFLLRMRQAACHPFLISVTKKSASIRTWGKNKGTRDAVERAMQIEPEIRRIALDLPAEERICAECDNDASALSDTYVMNGCGHLHCSECATNAQDNADVEEDGGKIQCPMCNKISYYLANLEILDVIEANNPRTVQQAIDALLVAQRPRVEQLRRTEEARKRRLDELRLSAAMDDDDDLFNDTDSNELFFSDTLKKGREEATDATGVDATGAKLDGTGTELDGTGTELDGTGTELDATGTKLDGTGTEIDGAGGELDGAELLDKVSISEKDPLEYKLDINEIAKLFKVADIFDQGWTSSAKVDSCLDCLREIWTECPDDKVILFSSFTSFLDILAIPLEAAQIPYAQYTGKMNVQERNETLDEFRRGRCRVLLTSLKAGNVGLTLTQANRVVIVEPFWNPYVEDQAQDRVHRIGQSREVTIYRLRIKDTVEDRIVDLQMNKRALIEGALDNGMKTKAKGLSRTDMLYALGLRRRPRPVESILRATPRPITDPNPELTITSQTIQ